MAVLQKIIDWWHEWWGRDDDVQITVERDPDHTTLILDSGHHQKVITMSHATAAALAARMAGDLTQSSDTQQSIATLRHIVAIASADIERIEGIDGTSVFRAVDRRRKPRSD